LHEQIRAASKLPGVFMSISFRSCFSNYNTANVFISYLIILLSNLIRKNFRLITSELYKRRIIYQFSRRETIFFRNFQILATIKFRVSARNKELDCGKRLLFLLSSWHKKANNKTNEQKYRYKNNTRYIDFPEKYLVADDLRILDDNDDKKYR
jgi:hypothetical protein